MTYLGFLVVFLVPPIAALAVLGRGHRVPGIQMPFGRAMGLICGIAFVYTTPWDNYLVYSGVWTYGEDRVIGTLFWVPWEEYLFFILQPVMTALWTRYLLARRPPDNGTMDAARMRLVQGVLWGGASVLGWVLLAAGTESTRYLALILGWASPVILALSLYAWRTLGRRASLLLRSIGPPTLFLWIADAIAIGNGVWTIESPTSLGWGLLGLPVEEALFFLVTNILVVYGLVTFLYGPGRPVAPEAA